jgi:hypothetical protein
MMFFSSGSVLPRAAAAMSAWLALRMLTGLEIKGQSSQGVRSRKGSRHFTFLLCHLQGTNLRVLNSIDFLKGHGNEADFLGFLQKFGPHRSLTLPFEPFCFWIRIREIFVIEKRLPESASRGVGDSPTRRYRGVADNFFQTFK